MHTTPFARHGVWPWIAALTVAGLLILAGAAVLLPSDRDIRQRIERTLADRFHADVALDDLDVTLFPWPRVEGRGLRLTPHGRPDVRPLLQVARFRAHTGWRAAFAWPRRVDSVELEGLRITVVPKENGAGGRRGAARGGCQGERRHPPDGASRPANSSPVHIARLSAPGAELELLPRNPAKQPLRFSIASLTVRDFALDRPFDFDAVLTNPTPRGTIVTHGRFGPWVADDPALSPVAGRYLFERADLGTIAGLGGTLTSKGRFEGVLEQILVSGAIETPDFSLETGGRAMPLHATFEACVDGSDGDTYLDAVNARLGSTPIAARGKVEGLVGVDGRTVSLEATVHDGRIEDLLRLAVKGDEPLMSGPVSLTHTLVLAPGDGSVVRRLQMRGRFGLEGAHFAAGAVQQKVDEFSRRGQGRPGDASVNAVASDVRGSFSLADGTLRLHDLSFAIPGASVRLRGRYGLISEQISLAGTVRLRAKPSQTTSGVTSLLLKLIDPLFARSDAGTVLPVHISGTRARPIVAVDARAVLTRKVK
jgi:hypothetical protein